MEFSDDEEVCDWCVQNRATLFVEHFRKKQQEKLAKAKRKQEKLGKRKQSQQLQTPQSPQSQTQSQQKQKQPRQRQQLQLQQTRMQSSSSSTPSSSLLLPPPPPIPKPIFAQQTSLSANNLGSIWSFLLFVLITKHIIQNSEHSYSTNATESTTASAFNIAPTTTSLYQRNLCAVRFEFSFFPPPQQFIQQQIALQQRLLLQQQQQQQQLPVSIIWFRLKDCFGNCREYFISNNRCLHSINRCNSRSSLRTCFRQH